jgi:nucleoside phosphorylase
MAVLPEAVSQFPYGEHVEIHLGTQSCRFFHCRRTKVRAAGACQYAIDHWRVDPLIVLGTCGGVAENLRVGDIVLANKTLQYDCEDRRPGMGAETVAEHSWLELPAELGQLQRGVIGSADRDLTFANVTSLRDAGVLVADWESAAIAAVCEFNGVRWAIFRGVSDVPLRAEEDDYQRQLTDYAQNTPAIMERMLTMLPLIVSGIRRHEA